MLFLLFVQSWLADWLEGGWCEREHAELHALRPSHVLLLHELHCVRQEISADTAVNRANTPPVQLDEPPAAIIRDDLLLPRLQVWCLHEASKVEINALVG